MTPIRSRRGTTLQSLLIYFCLFLPASLTLAERAGDPPGCAEEGGGEVPAAIHSSPAGAHLRFVQNGETITRGRTPFARLLPAGEYEVIATAGRGKQQSKRLILREGEAAALVFRFD